MTSPILTVLSLFLFIPLLSAISCKTHPAFSKSLKPVLISEWEFSNPSPTAEQSAYLRRHAQHVYAPNTDKKSDIYKNLDLFHPLSPPHRSIKMSFQRLATVYLFVDFATNNFKSKKRYKLAGWKDRGWAELRSGKQEITYGIHQTITKPMPRYAYVFKKVTTEVVLPSTGDVRKVTGGSGAYKVWIGEADGRPSPSVGGFKGKAVESNARCPDALHNMWMTKDPNKKDGDTRGKLFRSWHPAWDPCWWCAYDHDHGGDAGVFNYKPMYDYTAYKFDRQDESDAGFKGFVFSFGQHWVYFNVHILSSSLRRVHVRFHTINIVVAEKSSKKIVADLRFKADFGFAAVQLANRKMLPIDAGNERIRKALKRKMFRTINLFNPKKPDPKFLLKKRDLTRGVYEEWLTIPMCTSPLHSSSGVQFTLKTPGTGILALNKAFTPVFLGRTFENKLYKSLNLYRTVKFRRVTLSDKFCPGRKSGEFYTDVYGKRVLKGPGKDAVRQYMKPGFKLLLTGKHEVTDPWSGIYTVNKKGFFRDHGYGLNPVL